LDLLEDDAMTDAVKRESTVGYRDGKAAAAMIQKKGGPFGPL
jgi:hypothetical protein